MGLYCTLFLFQKSDDVQTTIFYFNSPQHLLIDELDLVTYINTNSVVLGELTATWKPFCRLDHSFCIQPLINYFKRK